MDENLVQKTSNEVGADEMDTTTDKVAQALSSPTLLSPGVPIAVLPPAINPGSPTPQVCSNSSKNTTIGDKMDTTPGQDVSTPLQLSPSMSTPLLPHHHEELTHRQTIRRRRHRQMDARQKIFLDLYTEAKSEKDSKDVCCVTCTDFCCGKSCLCGDVPMTGLLHKARVKGWSMLKTIIFPLIRDFVRCIWITTECIIAFIGLVLSIFRFNQNEVFTILHLALLILSSILTSVDLVYNLSGQTTRVMSLKRKIANTNAAQPARIHSILYECLLQK